MGASPKHKQKVKIATHQAIALMRDDVAISLVTSKRGLVVMVSREYLRNI